MMHKSITRATTDTLYDDYLEMFDNLTKFTQKEKFTQIPKKDKFPQQKVIYQKKQSGRKMCHHIKNSK